MKLLDWVFLLIESEKISLDQLHYGYQANSSTTMCTWTVSAVVEYYEMNGASVYGCAADMSKAFDMVSWLPLFTELQERDVSPIFLRLLLYIYTQQTCDVRWNGKFSHRFSISNGVRQGAVSSPILFSIYLDNLVKHLWKLRIGCQVGGIYLGILTYADDIFLMSANRMGLQAMLKECELFGKNIT